MSVYVAPHAVLVMRSSDWQAFVAGDPNRVVSPHARIEILPDTATPEELDRAAARLIAPPPLPPTG